VVAAELLHRVDVEGYTVMADKGFASDGFEQIMTALGARFLRPDRNDEPRRNGSLGPVRQWIESVISGPAGANSRSKPAAVAPSRGSAPASRSCSWPSTAERAESRRLWVLGHDGTFQRPLRSPSSLALTP
jgi:hypothetical protein